MPIEKILVLEDELIVRKNLEQHLRHRGFDVAAAPTLAQARAFLAKDTFDLVLADVRLPDGEGTELLLHLQSRPQKPLFIIMSALGTVQTAVECMRNGAFDYFIKPFSNDQLDVALKRAEEFTRLVKVNHFLNHSQEEEGGGRLLGNSPAIERVRQLIRKVAPTEATVFIQGESGTGKELVARAIYRQSSRANGPLIAVNCAAVPENLIESEFFGHEKGAFTGALYKREGRFELAHGGTIFLDEVSEISPQVQAKLLRVLQEQELQRVGGNRTLRVDVRVISSTNRCLRESLQRKEFREDLFFRLNVVPIVLPPLRELREDIPLLARHFVQRFARKHGITLAGLSPECLGALERHDWPGNVRELQNVIERAVILCSHGELLREEHLGLAPEMPLNVSSLAGAPATTATETTTAEVIALPGGLGPHPSAGPAVPLLEELDGTNARVPTLWEVEQKLILSALKRCHHNRTHAAKLIGISLRTIRNKLAEYRKLDCLEDLAPEAAEEAESDKLEAV
jgi:DNA-binding NtrC family response regulator